MTSLTFHLGDSTFPGILFELVAAETVPRVGDTKVLLLVVATVSSAAVDVGPIRIPHALNGAVNMTANVRLVCSRRGLCLYGGLVKGLHQAFAAAVDLGIA